MLARLAENLFWAGRYVERAEDTARLVDVTYHTSLEASRAEVGSSWAQLLEVLHLTQRAAERGLRLDAGDVVPFLVLDPDNPSSIVASIDRVRDNARTVRELVSSELWEVINDLYLALRRRDLRRDLADQPYELLGSIRRDCMTIYGVASETMPRDEGWRFMALGRMLERAEMTSRLLDVHCRNVLRAGSPGSVGSNGRRGADRPDVHHWVAVLKSASALEAYRRRYRSLMDPVDVVEFLLLEPQLPRSVLFCLTGAMIQLESLSDGATPATRRLGRATSALRYRDVGELFDMGLHDFLERIQVDVGEIAEAIAEAFFRHQLPGTMHAYAVAGPR